MERLIISTPSADGVFAENPGMETLAKGLIEILQEGADVNGIIIKSITAVKAVENPEEPDALDEVILYIETSNFGEPGFYEKLSGANQRSMVFKNTLNEDDQELFLRVGVQFISEPLPHGMGWMGSV